MLLSSWASEFTPTIPLPADFCVNLQLMDASTRGDLDKGVQLILFGPQAEELPQVKSPGDIILLRSVQVGRIITNARLLNVHLGDCT